MALLEAENLRLKLQLKVGEESEAQERQEKERITKKLDEMVRLCLGMLLSGEGPRGEGMGLTDSRWFLYFLIQPFVSSALPTKTVRSIINRVITPLIPPQNNHR